VLRDLSDRSTTARLELEAWAEGENIEYDATRPGDHTATGHIGTEENDIDLQLLQATTSGNLSVLRDWITRLKSVPDARDRFTRTFLSAISESSKEALEVLLKTGLVDIQAEDDVNERNCLHEAAISGRMHVLEIGISGGVDVSRLDAYGRIPLHYACLHGRVNMVRILVEAGPDTVDLMDHDNFTPLIHSIIRHQLECVEQVLSHNARIDPLKESDHVPLNLACQYGSVPIVSLLLERGAKLLPDAEGLFPQHLLARSGHSPDLLLLLKKYGADLNQKDKLYQWTPLFHAASEGRVGCLQTLLENGVDVDAQDEKGLSAMYYATWEGNLECMRLLWSRTGTSGLLGRRRSAQMGLDQFIKPPELSSTIQLTSPENSNESMNADGDAIPEFILPPPIIPLRRYGHNFIDTKAFVQISFVEAGSDAIQFYQEGRYPAARLTITSKLSDLIPRNVILPIQDDFRIVTFQIDNLDSFAVDFEIFPTFGSKVISKSVALPEVFQAISSSSGTCCLPLFDPRLRAIGQINFNFQVIKPFQGDPLEITHFATYWKATSALDDQNSGFITGSSLSGDYVQLFVQLTRDGIPILWPRYTINHQGIELPVGRLTYHQFKKIGSDSYDSDRINLSDYHNSDIAQMHIVLHRAFLSLQEALAHLPTSIHVNLSVLYPSAAEEHRLGIGPTININVFADAILRDVFDHARAAREKNTDFMRSMVFTSYNPQICTALNWKQPNCNYPHTPLVFTLLLHREINMPLPSRSRPPLQRPRRTARPETFLRA
jgi:CDK inhibitor PHO81